MDFSKLKKLTIGGVELKQLFINGIQVWKSGYKNWVKFSTKEDGKTIYNGGLGYKDGFRVRSGGAEAEMGNAACTGFMPVTAGDIVRLSGYDVKYVGGPHNAINVANASFTNLGQIVANNSRSYGCFESTVHNWDDVILEKSGVYYWVVPSGYNIAYIRVTGYGDNIGSKMIVTINEEID